MRLAHRQVARGLGQAFAREGAPSTGSVTATTSKTTSTAANPEESTDAGRLCVRKASLSCRVTPSTSTTAKAA